MNQPDGFIDPHGGFRNLKSYQMSEIVYDATAAFCDRWIGRRSRTHDQMVQAARSGKQNIGEGSMASGTSKKFELRLVSVARASLEELLLDYQDFLRQRNLPLWGKNHPQAQKIRKLAYASNRSYMTYKTYIEGRFTRSCRQYHTLSNSSDQLFAGSTIKTTGKTVFRTGRFHRKALSYTTEGEKTILRKASADLQILD